MRLPCIKANRPVLMLAASSVGVCLLLLATCLLFPVHIVDDIDWSHEARILAIQPNTRVPDLRYVLVPFTPFGREMVREFLRVSQTQGMTVSILDPVSVIASSPASFKRWRYLDAVLAIRLWCWHFWDRIRFIATAKAELHSGTALADRVEPLFTDGLSTRADNTLVDKLRELVRGAGPGSTIRFSVFLFFYEHEHEPLLDDLVAAAARGVNVQLLVDLPEVEFADRRTLGHLFKEAFEKRLQEAAAQGHTDSWIRTHPHKRPNSKNHTKIFLFSRTLQRDNVVVITSENLTDREREKYQAGFVVQSPELYAQMNHYIDVMARGELPGQPEQVAAPDLAGYEFPQQHDDPVYRELDRLRTVTGQMQQGHLYVAMARWDHDRFALAMKLVQLAREGLDITVVIRSNDEIVDTQIQDVLKNRANIHLHSVDVNEVNIHSKYMLFDGYYRADNDPEDIRRGKIVWTGSHNFTGAGLTDNYETWFEIHSDKLYNAYLDNFRQLEVLVPEAASP